MARVRILGKEKTIKESIKNVKRTFLIQKKFLKLQDDVDSDDTEKSIDASVEMMNDMVSYIADMAHDKEITTETIEDNLGFKQAMELTTKIIDAVLHVSELEKKADKEKNE